MAESILKLRVDSQEYDNKLKRASEGLQRYVDGCRKAGGTLEVVEQDTLAFVKSIGQMETVSRTAKGQLNELTQSFMNFSKMYNEMSEAEKNSPVGKALSENLEILKGRIQDNKAQIDEMNKSLNGGGGLKDSLNQVAGKFGLNIDQITKFGGIVGVTTTAVKVAKDAFFNMESGIDEWGRTVEGAKGAYSIFLDTLNNGNWSQFFQNLETAIQGGRDLYDVLDRLGSIKSNNAAAIAIVQQQIAQLRLAKQQGENVDAQLKSATERLAQLQKQSINAGKTAGNQTAFQTIRNSVNSMKGARVNDATIQLAVDMIMKNGQSEFDKFRRNRDILQQKGTRTVVTQLDDGMGGTVNKYRQVFDITLLSKEQQKQYKIAQAITESETQIQKGISIYAQAVQEGTQSAREQFKGNRYALQGSGRGGNSGKGGSVFDASKIEFMGGEGVKAVDTMPSVWTMLGDQGLRQMMGIGAQQWDYNKVTKEATGEDIYKSLKEKDKETGKLTTELGKVGDKMSTFASGLSSISSGFKGLGIDLPKGVDEAINVIQSLCSIIQGVNTVISVFSASAMTANTAAIMANTAALTTNSVLQFLPFAGGGIIPHAAGGTVAGTHFSGDVTPILANAGEVVLNKAETNNLATVLTANENGGNSGGRPYVDGETIYLGLNAYLKSTGRGEMMTSRFK